MKKFLMCLLTVILALCLVVPVVSCKGAAETTIAETTVAEATTAEATVAETTPAETTAAPEPKTIVWWTLFNENEAYADVFKEWVADYKEIHPEITIDIQWIGRDNISKVAAARGAGEVIDIMDQGVGGMVPIIQEGQTLALNDYLNTPSFDGNGTWLESFIPGINENYADANGQISAIIYGLYSYGIFYDKKLWSDNGWNPPSTWDELLALCEKIKTESNVAPITIDPADSYMAFWYWNLLVRLGGTGTLYNAYMDKTGEKWGDQVYLQAAELQQELLDKGYFINGFSGFTYPEGQKRLATREAAMLLCASWVINELKDIVPEDFEWGFFSVPSVSGGVGKTTDMAYWPLGWVIFKDSKVAPEAIDFLKFCTSASNAQKLAEATISLSSIKAAGTSPLLQDMKALFDDPNIKTFLTEDGIPGDYAASPFFKNQNDLFLDKISTTKFIEEMKKGTKAYWENK